jgi:PAS domain-containing protein
MAGIGHSARDLSDESFAEEKFRLAVESCPNGMVMSDGTGKIVLINAEAERLFGYERDELIGRPMEVLVPERLRGGYFERRAATPDPALQAAVIAVWLADRHRGARTGNGPVRARPLGRRDFSKMRALNCDTVVRISNPDAGRQPDK